MLLLLFVEPYAPSHMYTGSPCGRYLVLIFATCLSTYLPFVPLFTPEMTNALLPKPSARLTVCSPTRKLTLRIHIPEELLPDLETPRTQTTGSVRHTSSLGF